jgi:hypothetical protein
MTTPAIATSTALSKPEQLVEIADRIRARTAQAVIETGRDLMKAKKLLAPGGFGNWLQYQLGIDPKMAQRYMQVARWAAGLSKDENDKLSFLPNSALYELSARSTPLPACAAVFKALEAGERLNVATVRTLIYRNQPEPESGKPPKTKEIKRRIAETAAQEDASLETNKGYIEFEKAFLMVVGACNGISQKEMPEIEADKRREMRAELVAAKDQLLAVIRNMPEDRES